MTWRPVPDVPLRVAYTVTELSRGSGLERRRLRKILKAADITLLWSGPIRLVSISELERKVPSLWEGIKTLYALGAGGDD